MSIQRLIVLFAFMVLCFAGLKLLPKSPGRPDPGIRMELPSFVGEWFGEDVAVSQREIDILGADTTFARKVYSNAAGDHIFVSIVLAGEDMNTSIHRPERCLPAQGYVVMDSSRRKIEFGGDELSVTRLHNRRLIPVSEDREVTEYSLDYYWFVGSNETTPDHIERNLMDIRDRALKGYSQPWAFVTVMSRISEGLVRFGRNEEETDKMLDTFIQELLSKIQKDNVKIR